jgi:diguanylate cyclase (GGDEF)-like protein
MDHRDDTWRDAPLTAEWWAHGHDLALAVAVDGGLLDANPAARAFLPPGTRSLLDALDPRDASRVHAALTAIADGPAAVGAGLVGPLRVAPLPPDHAWRLVDVTTAVPVDGGWVLVARDVTAERRAVATLTAHREVLAMLAVGEPMAAALDALARSIEEASGGARVVALVARGDDLELAAAPNLRADAAAALSRLPGGADAERFPAAGALSGPLATAASEYGLGFGWAAPVHDGDVPRALLLLFPGAKRFPSAHEKEALEAAVPLAQLAVTATDLRSAARRAERVDPGTGVLTRAAFLYELRQLARRSRDLLGVMLVDVEGVEAVNREHGYGAGDAALRTIGERLARSIRGRDVAGRVSGTRFAVAGTAHGSSASFPQFASRVGAILHEPVVHDGAVLAVRCRLATCSRRGRVPDPEAVLLEVERTIGQGAEIVSGPDGERTILTERDPKPERRRGGRSGSARNDR